MNFSLKKANKQQDRHLIKDIPKSGFGYPIY